MRRTVDRADMEREPFRVWNAFVDLLAMEDYEDLAALQRQAHLVFWYGNEVENGGHDQYFGNRGTERVKEAVEALCALGLPAHAEVLRRAAAFEASGESHRFLECDDAHGACQPTVTEALQRHLESYRAEYVEIV